MKTTWTGSLILGAALMLTATRAQSSARVTVPDTTTHRGPSSVSQLLVGSGVNQSDWSGPRVGFSVAPGNDGLARRLEDHGLGRLVSQFGWHFEHQVTPFSNGPRLLTELTPLLGGMEYGKLVPSLTASVGVRSPGGYEIGMGPSVRLAGSDGGSVALVIAAGRSLEFGEIRMPINLAVSTNPKGTLITVLAGYAIQRATP